jgi:hypothetical protein
MADKLTASRKIEQTAIVAFLALYGVAVVPVVSLSDIFESLVEKVNIKPSMLLWLVCLVPACAIGMLGFDMLLRPTGLLIRAICQLRGVPQSEFEQLEI